MASFKQIWVKILGDNKGLNKSLKESEAGINQFGGVVKKIGGLIAGAFAVDRLVAFSKSAIQLSSQMEGVKTAFEALNRQGLLDNLRSATRNTVSDLKLMQAAVKAENFKIPLEQLGTYFEFATARSIQTGESVDYLVESIINGIGRKSVLVLDNLGISAAEMQEEMRKTGDFGAAAGQIISRELEKMGRVMDTTATKIEQLNARWENFKATAGTGLKEGFFAVIDDAVGTIDVLGSEMVTLGEKIKFITLGSFNKSIYESITAMVEMERSVNGMNLEMDAADRLLARVEQDHRNAAAAAAEQKQKQEELNAQIREFVDNLKLAEQELLSLGPAWMYADGQILSAKESLKKTADEGLMKFREGLKETTPDLYALAFAFDDMDEEMTDSAEGWETYAETIKDTRAVVRDVTAEIQYLSVQIASNLATALGQASVGAKSVEQALADVSVAIANAIGDILIMTGIGLGIPAGLPFLAAGLTAKFIGGAMGASMGAGSESIMGSKISTRENVSTTSNIYGNDIKVANDYATGLHNRVG